MIRHLPPLVRYVGFAGVATLVNLMVQHLVRAVYDGPFALFVSMGCATGSGLVLKYWLDRQFVFDAPSEADLKTDLKTEGRQFGLYAFFGLFTTLIFWVTETLFDQIGGPAWRDLGAILGLGLGYGIKYLLDKRFVFGGGGKA